jgi:hypothetical protein
MKKHLFGLATLVLMGVGAGQARADLITTDVFRNHASFSGGGAPFSDIVGSLTTNAITFGTDTGFNWHPFGLSTFGADIHGLLDVASTGSYAFSLTSDDGSLLFIDGKLVVDDGGAHPPITVSGTTSLTAGTHSFEVQFYEDLGGASGVDLHLPSGVTYAAAAPAPPGLILAGIGGLCLGLRAWRRRQAPALA